MREFRVPEYLKEKYPWLTEKYVRENAWHPVVDEWLKDLPEDSLFNTESPFGHVLCKSRDEFKPGDIIIFNHYDEWEDEEEGWQTDRFLLIEQEDIDQYVRNERELLPVGVVVHFPQPPDPQLKIKEA